MFLDQILINVESGKGGNGMVAWRKEKYVAYGGPAGGDGGRGGSVYIRAESRLQTLIDFRQQREFKASDGTKGAIKNQHGRAGADRYVDVPVGTVVYDAESGDMLADLRQHGQTLLVAQGGRGGRGNTRFSSSKNKAPHFAEPGEDAILRSLRLELRSIADVGLIGLPNAGKSTFLSSISAARPKIADYPFTTLQPNLGVVSLDHGDSFVVADIPGLIEGASEGQGLGHDFLRHVTRTRLLVHLVEAEPLDQTDPKANFDCVEQELAQYSQALSEKPRFIVISKADSSSEATLNTLNASLQGFSPYPLHVISSVTRQGLSELIFAIGEAVKALPPIPDPEETHAVDPRALQQEDTAFDIEKGDGYYVVEGGKVRRWLQVTDMSNGQSLQRFTNILKAIGVYKALKRAGAKAGDTLYIAGEAFDYYPDGYVELDESKTATQEGETR